MVHNPYLEKGESCILNYHDKNIWPQYLCFNIDIDENNWLFKNTDGFDLFTFIIRNFRPCRKISTKENKKEELEI
jgi:hypothetical protein